MKNNVDMTTGEGQVIDIMADVDFTLAGGDEDMADFAQVIQQVVLARCKERAKLGPGHYNIRLLGVVTRSEEP